jgi:sirohydrochlorin cobaltochelatase
METPQNVEKSAIILVGHGAVPADYPHAKVTRLKQMEAQRRRTGQSPSREEQVLDFELRHWPRTADNDPYQIGLHRLADVMRLQFPIMPIYLAYNEFCAPSLTEACAEAIKNKAKRLVVASTMMTPGGVHAEREIPEEISLLRHQYPNVIFEYAWPYDLEEVAGVILRRVQRTLSKPISEAAFPFNDTWIADIPLLWE